MALISVESENLIPSTKVRSLWQILLDGGFAERNATTFSYRKDKSERCFPSVDPTYLNAAIAAQEDLGSRESIIRSAAGERKPLGELLMNAKRISYVQLEHALNEQHSSGDKLGSLLVKKGWANKNEVDAMLEYQEHQSSTAQRRSTLKLGTILVNAGHISEKQLEDGITRQKKYQKKIGEILVEAGYAQPHQITRGLNTQRKLIKAALIALLSFSSLSAVPAAAELKPTVAAETLTTSPNYAKLDILEQPSDLQITRDDLLKGFVEFEAASQLHVKTNNRNGYKLVFETSGHLFQAIEVRGLGGNIQLGPEGGAIVQAYPGKLGTTITLSYRFMLPTDIRPGNYTWPLALSVMPI